MSMCVSNYYSLGVVLVLCKCSNGSGGTYSAEEFQVMSCLFAIVMWFS